MCPFMGWSYSFCLFHRPSELLAWAAINQPGCYLFLAAELYIPCLLMQAYHNLYAALCSVIFSTINHRTEFVLRPYYFRYFTTNKKVNLQSCSSSILVTNSFSHLQCSGLNHLYLFLLISLTFLPYSSSLSPSAQTSPFFFQVPQVSSPNLPYAPSPPSLTLFCPFSLEEVLSSSRTSFL